MLTIVKYSTDLFPLCRSELQRWAAKRGHKPSIPL